MAEEGRLTYREKLGLIVEARDGRVLAEVALTDGADFRKFEHGHGHNPHGSGVDLFSIVWYQFTREPRGYIDAEAVEVDPPLPELGPGGA
jgi:hypothetical protein